MELLRSRAETKQESNRTETNGNPEENRSKTDQLPMSKRPETEQKEKSIYTKPGAIENLTRGTTDDEPPKYR